MSDLDKLEKKYEKGSKAKEIRGSISKLKETPSNPDTKRAFESRKETLESIIRAAKQATAGFRSQWSGLDDEGKVGMGKGTPGIYYNTVALPALAGVVDEKYAPDFAVAADKKAGKIKEAVRKDMGINEPRGPLEHFSYAGGEMIGQIPVPGAWMNKIVGGVKKLGTTGKIAAAPLEYFTPTVDPKALNYGIGTTFGGTLGTAFEEEPTKKALGGLIQKYETGGKVGKVKSFFSAVDQAIDTLKQKKGTGEQILKQLEATPGVKKEELEARGIKQKLQASPKITQEELQKVAKQNKPSIPKRIKLGQGIDPDWQPRLEKHLQEALDELNIQPVVDPSTGQNFGFMHPETGEILDRKEIRALTPEELGLPVNPETGKIPFDDKESSLLYANVRKAVDEANQQFNLALDETKTKFGNYSKSGGKDNYREILLQNQDEKIPGAPAISQRIDELLKSTPETEEQAKAINEELDSLIDKISSKRQSFTAGHWNQPDVMAHYRVSDMTGPNGEKVLYVDEIQSDWHQRARDSRKREIKRMVNQESDSIRNQALEELSDANDPAFKYTYDTWHNHFLDTMVSPEVAATLAKERATGTYFKMPENAAKLKAAELRIKKERTAQLEKEVDENFGYKTPEDDEKLYQLNSQIERIRNTGLTTEELKDYFQPGKIVPGYGGKDKVLSFNSGENSEAFKQSYERKLAQARSAGVDEAAAEGWARRRALADAGDGWSVTVIEVDPATGQPRRGAGQRTHNTSPGSYIVDELRQQAGAIESKVPDAPFKKNWHELAVRDILDLAAKEGYDKVAFSPGVEQVKRYASGLRQAVDEIQFSVHEDGSLFIVGTKGSNPVFNGRVIGDTFIDGQAEGKSLSEVFGSNIAKQIEDQAPDLQEQMKSFRGIEMPDDKDAGDLLWQYGDKMTDDQRAWLRDFSERWELDVDDTPAGESMAGTMTEEYTNWLRNNRLKISPSDKPPISRISGENLTIGGEGMKSFYDKRLPDYVKEYGKKEFKAPTSYLEFKGTESPKTWSDRDVRAEMDQIDDMDRMDLMERAQDITQTRATEALARRGITPDTPNIDWQDVLWDEMDNHMDEAHGIALRQLAIESLTANAGKTPGLRTFSIDVTPEMKEKINTQGQRLHGFVAPQILPPLAAGAAGAEYVRQSVQQPPAEPQQPPQEQVQEPPEEPQALQKGGKVGMTREAVKKIMGAFTDDIPEVLSPKKSEKNLEKYVEKSKVKQRVFHGSNNPEGIVEDKGFYHYDPSSTKIHWTTDDPDLSDVYTSKYMEFPGEQGAIFPVHIQTKKPLKVPFDTDDYINKDVMDFARKIGFDEQDYDEWINEHDKSVPLYVWEIVNSPQFREAAIRKGFDSIAVKEGGSNTWGVFEPTQIKSTFNQGTYDAKDPDIGKRDGGPVGFQKGGKVGNMKDAAESLLRVLHGSPTKVRLDKEKNLDVTTDESYAMKRARDKMDMFGQAGPPMLNKFDVPAAKMLRFQETYSPEDVALMRRFFNRLPEGKSMTGEEIYDMAGGKDFVMEGIAKAGGMAGYERPAGGSGGVGNWYRVTDQEALTRKARGGLIQGYADGGAKGGKVDLARRGILGLSRLFEEPAKTANLPAVIPTTPLAKVPEATSPLSQLVQKTAETPMSRRDVLKKAGNVAISQAAKGVVPMALKEAVLEAIPIKVSPVGNVENAVKNLYINQMFDNFYDDAAGHGGTLFDAYESFLPFISQSLSKSEKKAIEKARDLFYEYGEDEIPSRIYDRISKGVDILQEKISEKGNDIPIKDVLSQDMYKMSLEDMKDYGVEITPDMVEQLRKTEWAPDVFHEFDTP